MSELTQILKLTLHLNSLPLCEKFKVQSVMVSATNKINIKWQIWYVHCIWKVKELVKQGTQVFRNNFRKLSLRSVWANRQ